MADTGTASRAFTLTEEPFKKRDPIVEIHLLMLYVVLAVRTPVYLNAWDQMLIVKF